MTESLVVAKERLRRRILQLRSQQGPEEIATKSARIVESALGLSEYQDSRILACYVSKGSEVQTKPLIHEALSWGKKVLVPIVEQNSRTLQFSEIQTLDELVPGTFGIPEPKLEHRRLTGLEAAEIVFVPGIAWDLYGYRVGWGHGYFDAALKRLPDRSVSIGLAFDLQLVEKVPGAQFDLPVDMLVTESRVARCNA